MIYFWGNKYAVGAHMVILDNLETESTHKHMNSIAHCSFIFLSLNPSFFV